MEQPVNRQERYLCEMIRLLTHQNELLQQLLNPPIIEDVEPEVLTIVEEPKKTSRRKKKGVKENDVTRINTEG